MEKDTLNILNNAKEELSENGATKSVEFISSLTENDAELIHLIENLTTDDSFPNCLAEYFFYLKENDMGLEWYNCVSLLFQETFGNDAEEFESFFDTFKQFAEIGLAADDLDRADKENSSLDSFISAVSGMVDEALMEESAGISDESDENDADETTDEDIAAVTVTEEKATEQVAQKNLLAAGENPTDGHTDDFIDYLKAEISKLKEDLDRTAKEKEDAAINYSNVLHQLGNAQEDYKSLEEKYKKAQTTIKLLENKAESNKKLIDKLNSINDRLTEEKKASDKALESYNPNEKQLWQSMVDDKNKIIESLEKQLEEARSKSSEQKSEEDDFKKLAVNDFENIPEEEVAVSVERDYDESEVTHLDLDLLKDKFMQGKKFVEGVLDKIKNGRFLKNNEQEQYALIMGKLANGGYSSDVFNSVKGYLRTNSNPSSAEIYSMLERSATGEEIVAFCNLAAAS